MVTDPTPFDVFQQAVAMAGGQTKFATICGCTQGNIWQLLKKQSPLPVQYVLKVEAALAIPRHFLRPDVYPADDTVEASHVAAPASVDRHVPKSSPEWPIQSANNGPEIISSEPPAAEGGHGAPFLPSSATCSPTSAPRQPLPASQACSTAGRADAA